MQKVPYVFYADFEYILEKVDKKNPGLKTIEYEEHKSCGFACIKSAVIHLRRFIPW